MAKYRIVSEKARSHQATPFLKDYDKFETAADYYACYGLKVGMKVRISPSWISKVLEYRNMGIIIIYNKDIRGFNCGHDSGKKHYLVVEEQDLEMVKAGKKND